MILDPGLGSDLDLGFRSDMDLGSGYDFDSSFGSGLDSNREFDLVPRWFRISFGSKMWIRFWDMVLIQISFETDYCCLDFGTEIWDPIWIWRGSRFQIWFRFGFWISNSDLDLRSVLVPNRESDFDPIWNRDPIWSRDPICNREPIWNRDPI